MLETSPAKLEAAIEVYKKLYPNTPIDIDLLEKIIKELR